MKFDAHGNKIHDVYDTVDELRHELSYAHIEINALRVKVETLRAACVTALDSARWIEQHHIELNVRVGRPIDHSATIKAAREIIATLAATAPTSEAK